MNTINVIKLSVLAACCSLALPVVAQTADGATPAEEDVCADESGRAKGLCNAYCEAMDCELGELANASPKACTKVKQNYQDAKGDATANLPCEKVECPCWDASDFSMTDRNRVDNCGVTRPVSGNIDAGRADYAFEAIVDETGCFFVDFQTNESISVDNISYDETQACIDVIDNFCNPL